jgi:hypothetical protein
MPLLSAAVAAHECSRAATGSTLSWLATAAGLLERQVAIAAVTEATLRSRASGR